MQFTLGDAEWRLKGECLHTRIRQLYLLHMRSDGQPNTRPPARCRAVAGFLLILFSLAVILPLMAAGSAEPTCSMSCCKRGSHRANCCRPKNASAAGESGAPSWKPLPDCPPGCYRTVWGFSSVAPVGLVPPKSWRIPVPETSWPLVPMQRCWPHRVLATNLFQRPPPSFFL